MPLFGILLILQLKRQFHIRIYMNEICSHSGTTLIKNITKLIQFLKI